MLRVGVNRGRQASDAHRKALQQNPDIASSRSELVSLYRALGRKQEARNEEEELRRLYPKVLPDILAREAGGAVPGQASSEEKMPTPADASGRQQIQNPLR